jgi:hypothetical protein
MTIAVEIERVEALLREKIEAAAHDAGVRGGALTGHPRREPPTRSGPPPRPAAAGRRCRSA